MLSEIFDDPFIKIVDVPVWYKGGVSYRTDKNGIYISNYEVSTMLTPSYRYNHELGHIFYSWFMSDPNKVLQDDHGIKYSEESCKKAMELEQIVVWFQYTLLDLDISLYEYANQHGMPYSKYMEKKIIDKMNGLYTKQDLLDAWHNEIKPYIMSQ